MFTCRHLLLLSLLSPTCLVPSASAQAWKIGQEREVDAGYYAKLVAERSGWRVWRFQTKSSLDCDAYKSAIGRPHPAPVGSGFWFEGGTPFIHIFRSQGALKWGFHGRGDGEIIEWRLPGERFWNEYPRSDDLAFLDGKMIEVHIRSWKYPASRIGFYDEYGIIDLRGMGEVVDLLKSCQAK